MIITAENAAKFGLRAGVNIFNQVDKVVQVAVRLEAIPAARAVGQSVRAIGAEGVVGGVVRFTIGVGGALATFSADAH